MLGQKGFTWPPYPSSVLCKPVTVHGLSWNYIIFAGQHSLVNDRFTLLPVVARNSSTRGLTFGTIPSPSVSQERPMDASATRCKEPQYASTHMSSLFPCLSRGSQRPISMLLGAGGQAAVSRAADHCQVDSAIAATYIISVRRMSQILVSLGGRQLKRYEWPDPWTVCHLGCDPSHQVWLREIGEQ